MSYTGLKTSNLVLGFGMFAVIIAITLLIGLWAGRKVKNSDDFFVGGRRLGLFVSTCTQCATWIGGAMTVAWISFGYENGGGAFWYTATQSIGCFFTAFFLVKFFRSKKFTSLPDYFESVYKNKLLTFLFVLVTMVTPITWVASQLTASARVMEGVLGIDFTIGILISAGVVLAYSVFGGFTSVVYTDCFQFLLLFILFLIVAPQPLLQAGGVTGILKALPDTFTSPIHFNTMSHLCVAVWMVYGLTEFLSNQTSYQRIYSAKNMKTARMAIIITGILTVGWGILTPLVGMAIYKINPGLTPDTAFSWFLGNRTNRILTMALLACVMMATMSTADSCVNSISVNISYDIFKKYIRPNASDKVVLNVGRWASLTLGIISVYWALQGGSIVSFFSFTASLSAGPLTGAVLYTALIPKFRSVKGMTAGLIAGVVAGIVAMHIPALDAIVGGGVLVSCPITVLVAVIVGAFTKDAATGRKADEICKEDPVKIVTVDEPIPAKVS